jgi:hypothetical protein
MEAMPSYLEVGERGWAVRKSQHKETKYTRDKDGFRGKPREVTVWGYDTPSREASRDLKAWLKGYKVLWDAADKDVDEFKELIRKFRDGEIVVPHAEESTFETLGLVGSFVNNYDGYGSGTDRYDFGPWNK